ncbi:MAG TPA: carbamate kinase [Candidatus Thermoplasmatota archaeon]|nr:carbamate kinase [Candidatus Thermoplasmatota archaeon]
MKKRAVIALGGNALIKKGQKGTIYEQFVNTRESCRSIVQMIQADWDVVITHGNGPQVGALVLQNQAAKDITPEMPLGICVAESEGLIGYMVQQCLSNALKRQKITKPVIALITQVIVDPNDKSLTHPSKPIGPYYKEDEALELLKQGASLTHLPRGWRMVVPSPDPIRIVEGEIIRKMLDDGIIVIASGGGGMPVIEKEGWGLDGLEAVVDKDLAAERLAEAVRAQLLLILTDVEKVYLKYNTPAQQPLDQVTVKELREYYMNGEFPEGSMGPKILAALRFLEYGGEKVIISNIEQGWEALQGKTGTHITKN